MVYHILFRTSFLLFVLPAVLAQDAPVCVSNCETSNPSISFCNGDETGTALDDCTCQSYESAPALITCIQGCPADQASFFIDQVPESCRAQLFPDAPSGSATTSGAAKTTSTPATTVEGNDQMTSSSTGTASYTGSATTTAQSEATSTGAAVANMDVEWRSVGAIAVGALGLMML